MLTPGVDPRARHMFIIDRVPGQIYAWPQESADTQWFPVWVISMGHRRGQAVYCGNDIDSAGPVQHWLKADRHLMHLWKDIL